MEAEPLIRQAPQRTSVKSMIILLLDLALVAAVVVIIVLAVKLKNVPGPTQPGPVKVRKMWPNKRKEAR